MSMWLILESIRSKKGLFCYRIGKNQKISSLGEIAYAKEYNSTEEG